MTCRRHRWRCDLWTRAFCYLECGRCGARKLVALRPVPSPVDREWLEGRLRVD